jgi:hypothetical protein
MRAIPIDQMTAEDWEAPVLWECRRCGFELWIPWGPTPDGWLVLRESIFGIDALCPACALEGES